MEMDVWHLQPRQHDADARRLEAGHLRLADRLRNRREMRQQTRIEVDPVIDLLARDHQRVPGAQRTVGEEHHAEVVLPDESGGQLTGDDP